MLLWDLKDNDISLANFPLPFKILSLKGSGRLILSSRFLPRVMWSYTFSSISSDGPQLSLCPFSIISDVQWHGYLKYTHIHTHMKTHTFIYSWNRIFEKEDDLWYVHITFFLEFLFLISEWYKAQFMAEMLPHIWEVEGNRNQLNSQAWEGLKEKVITAGTGDSQVYPLRVSMLPAFLAPRPTCSCTCRWTIWKFW